MIKQSPLFLIMFLLWSFAISAQETDHPTISGLAVSYTQNPNIDFVPDSVIKVRVNAQIELNSTASPSSIHLKIKNAAGDALLYEVSYQVASAPVINDAGIMLYNKLGSTIIIKLPDYISLASYQYEVTTEDSEAAISPVYSSFQ